MQEMHFKLISVYDISVKNLSVKIWFSPWFMKPILQEDDLNFINICKGLKGTKNIGYWTNNIFAIKIMSNKI